MINPAYKAQDPANPKFDSAGYERFGPMQYELNLHLIASAARYIGAMPIFLTQARLVSSSNTEADRQKIGYSLVRLSHEDLVGALADCDKAVLTVAKAE